VIRIPVTRVFAAVLLVSSVTIAPLLDNGDVLTSPGEDPVPVQSPQFQIERQHGELSLTGHTSSLHHEQTLLNVAKSAYPDSRIITEFQALGIVPKHWPESTVLVLNLLRDLSSAEAIMSASDLNIRGVIVDEPAWKSRIGEFRAAMPAHMAIDIRTVLVNPAISVAAICERAFESFELGRINFEESGVEFLSSAYPRLDRLIALANACYESQILITGHTDASGSEAWNRALSLRRANAVGDYIANGGISRERLQTSGLGSAQPVADNGTRFGRSLNRRIEIEFSLRD